MAELSQRGSGCSAGTSMTKRRPKASANGTDSTGPATTSARTILRCSSTLRIGPGSGFEHDGDDHRPTTQLPADERAEAAPNDLLQLAGVVRSLGQRILERLDDARKHVVEHRIVLGQA